MQHPRHMDVSCVYIPIFPSLFTAHNIRHLGVTSESELCSCLGEVSLKNVRCSLAVNLPPVSFLVLSLLLLIFFICQFCLGGAARD